MHLLVSHGRLSSSNVYTNSHFTQRSVLLFRTKGWRRDALELNRTLKNLEVLESSGDHVSLQVADDASSMPSLLLSSLPMLPLAPFRYLSLSLSAFSLFSFLFLFILSDRTLGVFSRHRLLVIALPRTAISSLLLGPPEAGRGWPRRGTVCLPSPEATRAAEKLVP